MKGRRCPVCNKSLTEKEYQNALGIMGKMKDHLTHQIEALQRERNRLRLTLKSAKSREAKARRDGADSQRQKDLRLMRGQKASLAKAKERIRQLEKGTTPQQEG